LFFCIQRLLRRIANRSSSCRPLGKLGLGDQHWLDPLAAFYDRRGDALTPAPGCFLRQVHEGARWPLDLLEAIIEMFQGFLGEIRADPTGEQEAVRAVVSDKQSAEVIYNKAFNGRCCTLGSGLIWSRIGLEQSEQLHFHQGFIHFSRFPENEN
jgi:hypothetical protein